MQNRNRITESQNFTPIRDFECRAEVNHRSKGDRGVRTKGKDTVALHNRRNGKIF